MSTNFYASKVYLWYKNGVGFPLLSLISFSSPPVVQEYGYYQENISVSAVETNPVLVEASVYPNPSPRNLTIQVKLSAKASVGLALYDATG